MVFIWNWSFNFSYKTFIEINLQNWLKKKKTSSKCTALTVFAKKFQQKKKKKATMKKIIRFCYTMWEMQAQGSSQKNGQWYKNIQCDMQAKMQYDSTYIHVHCMLKNYWLSNHYATQPEWPLLTISVHFCYCDFVAYSQLQYFLKWYFEDFQGLVWGVCLICFERPPVIDSHFTSQAATAGSVVRSGSFISKVHNVCEYYRWQNENLFGVCMVRWKKKKKKMSWVRKTLDIFWSPQSCTYQWWPMLVQQHVFVRLRKLIFSFYLDKSYTVQSSLKLITWVNVVLDIVWWMSMASWAYWVPIPGRLLTIIKCNCSW